MRLTSIGMAKSEQPYRQSRGVTYRSCMARRPVNCSIRADTANWEHLEHSSIGHGDDHSGEWYELKDRGLSSRPGLEALIVPQERQKS